MTTEKDMNNALKLTKEEKNLFTVREISYFKSLPDLLYTYILATIADQFRNVYNDIVKDQGQEFFKSGKYKLSFDNGFSILAMQRLTNILNVTHKSIITHDDAVTDAWYERIIVLANIMNGHKHIEACYLGLAGNVASKFIEKFKLSSINATTETLFMMATIDELTIMKTVLYGEILYRMYTLFGTPCDQTPMNQRNPDQIFSMITM